MTDSEPDDRPRLPPELLLPIFEILAADRALRTLANVLLASNTSYELGLPSLLRNMELTSYRHDLSAKLMDPAKFRHVRWARIHSPRGFGFFKLCVPHLEEIEVELSDAEFARRFWASLGQASKLKRIRLIFGPQPSVFIMGETALPPGVQFLDSSFHCRDNAAGFVDMLVARAPGLEEWTLRTSMLPSLSLSKEPVLLAKLKSLQIPGRMLKDAADIPGLQLNELRLLMMHVVMSSDGELFDLVSRIAPKERLVLSDVRTKVLIGLDHLDFKLPLLSILSPWPSEVFGEFDRTKEAVMKCSNLEMVELAGKWASDPLDERSRWIACDKAIVIDGLGYRIL